MRRTSSPLARAMAAALVAGVVATAPPLPVSAFDTGPHASLTLDALTAAGFNQNAANAVQVENWLTDYYTNTSSSLFEKGCDLDKLHMDDLFNKDDVRQYWLKLESNAHAAVLKAQQDDDVVEYYVVLGMSLHVVQDFYSHSNWVEQNRASVPAGHYGTRTWVDSTPLGLDLHTGWYANCLGIPQAGHDAHGDASGGLNHDSVVRPGYAEAYVYAYAASYEWTKNLLDWLGPAFRAKVLNYAPAASDLTDLEFDQMASISLSEWAASGHWNGPGSANTAQLVHLTTSWTGSHDSVYVATFNSSKIYASLSRNLYVSSVPDGGWPMTHYPITGSIFTMHTVEILQTAGGPLSQDGYFGLLTAQPISDVAPAPVTWYRDAGHSFGRVPWQQSIFVPEEAMGGPLNLTYTLYHEEGYSSLFKNTINNEIPIAPLGPKGFVLAFHCVAVPARTETMCGGDIAGGPWTEASPYVTEGQVAGVKLYFTASPAEP